MRVITFMVSAVIVIGGIALLNPSGCVDDAGAIRAAQGFGFSEVKTTGYRWYGCSENDYYHTGFVAKNVKGEPVSGVVCSSWAKNATVRLD